MSLPNYDAYLPDYVNNRISAIIDNAKSKYIN